MKFLLKILMIFSVSYALIGSELVEDWLETYNFLLKKYVVQGKKEGIQTTLVNYQGLRGDRSFRRATYDLARLPSIEALSKDDQLAMWINAYNFLMLKIVVENPKIHSIKQLDSAFSRIWKKEVGVVAGKTYSLDEIEHDIIRKRFQEPRIHFVLNCSSLSCGDLANFAYEGKYLEEQLAHQTELFLKNRTKGMAISGNKIYLSKIFKWYKEDFDPDIKGWLIANGFLNPDSKKHSIRYLKYNWDLNSLKQ